MKDTCSSLGHNKINSQTSALFLFCEHLPILPMVVHAYPKDFKQALQRTSHFPLCHATPIGGTQTTNQLWEAQCPKQDEPKEIYTETHHNQDGKA